MTFFLFMLGCSDYDLHRDEKTNPGTPEEEPMPEPTEAPQIVVTPNPIEFGSILKDCPATPIEVTVTNRGYAPLDVSDVFFDGQGHSVFGHNAMIESLDFDESFSFDVDFTPGLFLDYDVDLVFESNDPNSASYFVDTTGKGASGALYEESFSQTQFNKVDVLWVVDNSGSMTDVVSQLRTNFEIFIDGFIDLGLDYKMASITTDMADPTHQGRIQGSVITSAMSKPDAIAEFLSQVDVGDQGSADEQGFAAVKAALSAPLINNENSGFLRSDAALSIIFVSDENDYSSINTPDFLNFLSGVQPDASLLRINGFVGVSSNFDLTGCTVDAPGEKYIDAIFATGGFSMDICTTDITGALSDIASSTAGLTVNFSLSQEPVTLSSITVTVDGNVVPQDLFDGWTYVSDSRTIVFHGDGIPQMGSSIEVSYDVASECGN